MPEVVIVPYCPEHLLGLKEVFFESSTRKEFPDDAERENFFYKYAGVYLELFPGLAKVALGDGVLGYCLGAGDSSAPQILKLQPHLKVFEDLFVDYPAHFHINCLSRSRGQGLGARLLGAFEEEVKSFGVGGVHLMTAPEARNRSFYARAGYGFEVIRPFQRREILFLGKIFDSFSRQNLT